MMHVVFRVKTLELSQARFTMSLGDLVYSHASSLLRDRTESVTSLPSFSSLRRPAIPTAPSTQHACLPFLSASATHEHSGLNEGPFVSKLILWAWPLDMDLDLL